MAKLVYTPKDEQPVKGRIKYRPVTKVKRYARFLLILNLIQFLIIVLQFNKYL